MSSSTATPSQGTERPYNYRQHKKQNGQHLLPTLPVAHASHSQPQSRSRGASPAGTQAPRPGTRVLSAGSAPQRCPLASRDASAEPHRGTRSGQFSPAPPPPLPAALRLLPRRGSAPAPPAAAVSVPPAPGRSPGPRRAGAAPPSAPHPAPGCDSQPAAASLAAVSRGAGGGRVTAAVRGEPHAPPQRRPGGGSGTDTAATRAPIVPATAEPRRQGYVTSARRAGEAGEPPCPPRPPLAAPSRRSPRLPGPLWARGARPAGPDSPRAERAAGPARPCSGFIRAET